MRPLVVDAGEILNGGLEFVRMGGILKDIVAPIGGRRSRQGYVSRWVSYWYPLVSAQWAMRSPYLDEENKWSTAFSKNRGESSARN